MPYWSIYCMYCGGYIADALLECLPAHQRLNPAFRLLFQARPGAALACPYCETFLGFDNNGNVQLGLAGWPVFRYGHAELEIKKRSDGEAADISLTDWALRNRFTRPGSHLPFETFTYAEQAPPDEVVP